MYSEEDPAALSDKIMFACQIGCIAFTDNLRVTWLIIRGTDEETARAFEEKLEAENRVIRTRDYPKQTF